MLRPIRSRAWRAAAVGLLSALALGAGAAGARAQLPLQKAAAAAAAVGHDDDPAAPAQAAVVVVAPDSPRASLIEYLSLCRHGRWDAAARCLEVPPELAAQGGQLARRLKAVFDRYLWFNLDTVSPSAEGNSADDLPPELDEIGRIPTASGLAEPVRLVRVQDGATARWVFTASTVEKIDTWYEKLPDRWAIEYLPPQLLRPGPMELLWWQWLALPIVAVLAWIIGWLLGLFTKAVLGRLVARTKVTWDDEILLRVGGPLVLAWTLVAIRLLIPFLGLYQPAEEFIRELLRAGLYLVFFWSVLRSVDVVHAVVEQSQWALGRPGVRTLLPLAGRLVKLLLLGMAVVAALSQLGFPVATLIAGLGFGGLIIALAAQKTGENLFAAFSISVDQPFAQGDTVKVDDIEGVVEAIGLRSTRIRTPDRTIVTLPNGRLAEMRVESLTSRDRMRLAATIGLTYGTKAEQLRAILAGFEQVLRAQPELWPDTVVVRFKAFGESSLDVEVTAWFRTVDPIEFGKIRERVLLAFMDVVEKNGSDFAFPTRTVHLVGERPGEAGRA